MKIKFFHQLTKEEFKALPEMTWAECANLYPQPKWCKYPEAVCGVMGCWGLMSFWASKEYCKDCEYYE